MSTDHYNLHGVSLLDYLNGETETTIAVYGELVERRDVPVRLFFREPADFPALEQRALELCRGRVLDIGAGAGCHTLALQERGLTVCAIDFLPECVEVMKKRGVREAHCADIHTFEAEAFDTLFSMMNGMAVVRDLSGLQPFLKEVRRLLKPDGQFLVDSTDMRRVAAPGIQDYLEKKRGRGEYFGEMHLQLEYKGRRGAPFTQLHVDAETLSEHAAQSGWDCQIIEQDESGRYLARLTLAQHG
ncbi:MAG TPA: class I SAM-dependent methyltransferase [Pyrinomonadaceae bacterium]|jgi:SAM-dependent methyltransferase